MFNAEFSGPDFSQFRPVAISDTVDNIYEPRAVAVQNRSAATMLINFRFDGGRTGITRLNSGDAISWGHAWTRVLATGTTGGGTSGVAYEPIHTTGNGAAFGNQPANDSITVVSADAADTTQTLTVYGTTNGTDTVVVEDIALNGTTPVVSTKLDWGVILGFELSAACAGIITVTETSGAATVTTIAAAATSKGVETVTTDDPGSGLVGPAYNVAPVVVASGATTKQIGLVGVSQAGTTIRDSQALTGATAVQMNTALYSVTKILTGDLESNRTVSFSNSADLIYFI